MKRLAIVLIAAALFSCKQKSEVAAPVARTTTTNDRAVTAVLPPGHPPLDGSAPADMPTALSPRLKAAPPNALTGKVLETIAAGEYTYLRLETAGGSEWVAVPQTSVKKGETVNVAVQMTMEKFESKTLNRTFDRILFGTIANAAPPAQSAAPAAMTPPPPGAKTVAEVLSQKAQLKDTAVLVHGKVFKFLPEIMGKNWLHLKDSTGTNDLTVTTTDTVKVGDVITVKGTLHTDKDFGSGYTYAVIIEDASVVK